MIQRKLSDVITKKKPTPYIGPPRDIAEQIGYRIQHEINTEAMFKPIDTDFVNELRNSLREVIHREVQKRHAETIRRNAQFAQDMAFLFPDPTPDVDWKNDGF